MGSWIILCISLNISDYCRATVGKVSGSDLLTCFWILHSVQGCTLQGMSKRVLARRLPPLYTVEQKTRISNTYISVGSAAYKWVMIVHLNGRILWWKIKQCSGSMIFWGGSGSGSLDPCFWIMDPDPDPAIFVIDLQDASKKLISNTIFSAYYFLKVHLHHFSKIKSQKESQNTVEGIKVFLIIFARW